MDLSVLVNAPREITLAGKSYLVSALTLKEWGALQAYLKDRAVNPVVAALGQLSAAKAAGIRIADEDRTALFIQAKAEAKPWPPMVGSNLWFDSLISTEGASALLYWVDPPQASARDHRCGTHPYRDRVSSRRIQHHGFPRPWD